jgi:hypothetical protein
MGISCPHCNSENLADASFCDSCGKALPSSASAGPSVVTAKKPMSRLATRYVADDLKRQTKKAAGALLAVAILQVIGGTFIIVMMNSNQVEVPPVLYLVVYGVAVLFFGLFLWARKNPFPAAIAGLVLFVTVHGLDAVVDPKTLANGILVKIIIIAILIRAIGAGQKYNQISKSLAEIDGAR